MDLLLKGIHELRELKFEKFLVYTPVPHHDIEHALHRPKSPVRVFTLIGALTGFCTGWTLTIGSVVNYPLIVGGKPLVSVPPFGVIAYILTILFGSIATMIGFLANARLPRLRISGAYDERLSSDHYGIQIFGNDETLREWESRMKKAGAVEIRKEE
jgi:molybdopterin-containing oxidoreductase family membrane subunit